MFLDLPKPIPLEMKLLANLFRFGLLPLKN
jgi:hypothetical protein